MNDDARSGPQTDEERARAALEQLKSVHAFDLAQEMMIGLVSFGYQKMGLTDATLPLRNLDDAHLAIELLRANLRVIEREQGEKRTRDLHATLAQMQLSFARAVQLAGAERQAAAGAHAQDTAAAPVAEEVPVVEETPAGAGVADPEGAAAKEPAARKPAAKKPRADKPAAKRQAAKKPRRGAAPKDD